MGASRDAEVRTEACPLPLTEAQEARVRAGRAARAAQRRAAAAQQAARRGALQGDLDGAVAEELDRLARAATWEEERPPPDPHAARIGARVQACDGTRFLVVKVSQRLPTRDQVAVELFKRLGD